MIVVKLLRSIRFWGLLFLLSITLASHADKVHLNDGSVIVGDVVKLVDGKVTVKTTFAGEISFAMTEVVTIETDESKPIHLSDGSIIQGTIDVKDSNRLEVVRKKGETGFTIDASEIQAINPPPPTPKPKPKWTGEFVGNLGITTGNSDTKGIGVSTNLKRRNEADRINLRAGYFYSEDEGKGTRDDQFIIGKYDYFFNKQLFAYLTSRLDRDVIRELDLRTTGGAGAGYQFIETKKLGLFGEMGLSYVNEDFVNDFDDQSYVAGRMAGQFVWWILEERLRFTEDLEILLGIEDVDDWFAISESALTWNWTKNWSANAGIRYEYDNTPARGFDRADTKYTLGIGYSF